MKCPSHTYAKRNGSPTFWPLTEYALPDSWTKSLNTMLIDDEQKSYSILSRIHSRAQSGKIGNLQGKLQRLLDSYLDQDIDRETYLAKKAELMSEKKSLEEQNSKLTLTSTAWVEPMRQWITKANSICQTAQSADLHGKKYLTKEIFGSNLILKSQKAQPMAAPVSSSPPENIWFLLRPNGEVLMVLGSTRIRN